MSERRTVRFEIEGHDPSTMPLDRLLQYLEPLVDLLGTTDVHLVAVDEGSTVPVLEYADNAVDARLITIGQGRLDAQAIKAQSTLNERLAAHGTVARLSTDDGTTILRFPGGEAVAPAEPEVSVREAGQQDGIVISIGGVKDVVPLKLETFEGRALAGFKARRDIAKPLAKHLFEPVRLFGVGRWTRRAAGWQLNQFDVDRFEPLPDPLTIPDALREIRGERHRVADDAIMQLLEERLDESA